MNEKYYETGFLVEKFPGLKKSLSDLRLKIFMVFNEIAHRGIKS